MLLALRQVILSLLLRTAPVGFTRPTDYNTLNLGLFTTMPADDGTGGVEATGSSYARVAKTASDANFNIASDQVTNVAEIQFPLLTGSLLEVVGWGVWDNGGVLRWAQPAGDIPVAFVAATDDTLTRAAHTFADKQTVRVIALEGLPIPTGFAANTTYYVRDAGASTIKLAATEAGAAIEITAAGACFLRRWYGKTYAIDDRPVIPAAALKFKLAA